MADRIRLPGHALGARAGDARRHARSIRSRHGRTSCSAIPAVYPPVFILLSVPLALLPSAAASWLWFCLLGACVLFGTTDPRGPRLALLPDRRHVPGRDPRDVLREPHHRDAVLLIAIAWRYRERGAHRRHGSRRRGCGEAVRLARGRVAAAHATLPCGRVGGRLGRGVLVFGSWALIGFEGLRDYPTLLREVQDVYAERSLSLSTVAGGARRGRLGRGGDRRASPGSRSLPPLRSRGARGPTATAERSALAVGACVVASPIVWPNYAALLFVPIAIVSPRLSPLWFFGYVTWFLGAVAPKPSVFGGLLQAAGRPGAGMGVESYGAGALVRRRVHAGGGCDCRGGRPRTRQDARARPSAPSSVSAWLVATDGQSA